MEYLYLLPGLLIGLFLFICCIKAYTIGLKHSFELVKGNVPKLNLNPIQPLIKAVEEHNEQKEAEKAAEELTDIMSASMESMLQAVKKER